MPVGPSSIEFPVLAISSDGNISVSTAAADFETVNALALRSGYYKDLEIIQSDGLTFRVSDVTDIRPGGPFWGVRFMKPRRLRVRIHLEPMGRLDLDAAKAKVINAVERDPHTWEALVGMNGVAGVRRAIRKKTTIGEIIAFVASL